MQEFAASDAEGKGENFCSAGPAKKKKGKEVGGQKEKSSPSASGEKKKKLLSSMTVGEEREEKAWKLTLSGPPKGEKKETASLSTSPRSEAEKKGRTPFTSYREGSTGKGGEGGGKKGMPPYTSFFFPRMGVEKKKKKHDMPGEKSACGWGPNGKGKREKRRPPLDPGAFFM